MYERFLNSATVLGNGEKYSVYFRVGEDGKNHYEVFSQFTWGNTTKEEKCCSECKGEEE
jgi:hypothetical protein